MNTNIININNKDLSVKEYKNQRVVTFKDIDEVHQRPKGTAKRNFNRNKKHFIEEEDFFFVKPADIQTYEIRTSEINNAGTYLVTESGYLMIVKSFTDDLAWEVQRELVKSYFRRKELLNKLENLSPMLKQLINMEFTVNKIKERQDKIAKNVAQLNSIVAVEDNTTLRQQFNQSVRSLAANLGKPHKNMYNEVYRIINNNENINLKARATHRGVSVIDVLEQDGYLEYGLRIVNTLFQKSA